MTRIDPNAFAQNYLAGAQLGTQQFRIVDEMQQRQLAQQREQEQLQRTRMILKSVLQQSAAPALTGVPEQGMGPMPDSGGFAGAIEQNNKDVEELSAMIDVAGPESLRYISGLVDDRRKVSKALADARHAWDRGIAGHIDPKRHQDFAAFAQLFAAEQDPERKMARLDQFYQQQQEKDKAERWDRRESVQRSGRIAGESARQAFTLKRDKEKAASEAKAFEDKVARVSQNYQTTRGWSKEKADAHAYLVLSNAENEPASLGGVRNQNIEKDPDLREANQKVEDIDAAIKRIEDSANDDVPVPADVIARRVAPLRQQRKTIIEAANARYRTLYGGGESPQPSGYGLPQTTSTTSAPAAPTQAAPVADDATVAEVIKALTARLGREPTDDEIDAAMEGV